MKIMNADSAIKLEEPANHGGSSGLQGGEVAGLSVGKATIPAKGVSGPRDKSPVRGSRRRGSRGVRTDDKGAQSEESQSLLTIGRGGQVVSETAPAERASLSAEMATPPSSSTKGFNLKQKLAEVRRRICYIQKRGHNERFNYSYVTAADIAGAVGDALAELEVVVIPKLESISHENISPNPGYSDRLTRVVMTYTFMDVNSAEELTVKMPGEGRDPGDKGPYKAMTGALKYALLQSFLIATGDDPEDERVDSGQRTVGNGDRSSDPLISPEQSGQLYELIEQTGTDVAKMLEYFKISKIEEMTIGMYGRAVRALKRKQVIAANGRDAHA
jgi:ERF superfamily